MARTSAQRKFRRGCDQVAELLDGATEFEHSGAYEFTVEHEDRGLFEVVYRCYGEERKPIPEEWDLLAGEAIQNLRASLDHAVWAAAERPNSNTKFPIFTDSGRFESIGRGNIERVSEELRAIIEKRQPFKVAPQAPEREPLEVLRLLSNQDKHRTLTTVASAVGNEHVAMPENVDVSWERYGTNRMLGPGRTHLSTLVAMSSAEWSEGDVQPGFSYRVQIEGLSITTLRGIAHRVFEVLVECETGKRPDPFGPYPLGPG